MNNDDAPVGRLLSRRETLALFGAGSAVLVIGAACGSDSTPASTATSAASGGSATASTTAAPNAPTTAAASSSAAASTAGASATVPSCVAVPQVTEGPYFVDEKLNRSDIRTDPSDNFVRPGVTLVITMNVLTVAANACAPLAQATVDVWHCDAAGVYSDVNDMGSSTKGKKFLRGFQVSDATGKVQFTTIYPGWYQGRATHIHYKVRGTTAAGKTFEFTSQLFFDEATNNAVYASAPYTKSGSRTLNASDGIYNQAGKVALLPVTKSGDGYAGTFNLGMKL